MKNSLRPLLILICCALFALATGRTFAAGEFQKARDGKTTIWNWQPKAGETADWSGGRDKDGYANGFGDLTWYDANGKTFGLFYGKMAHGKFEGGVNVHTGNRISHAYFVDGERVTAWGRGAAKSNMTESEAAVVEQRKVEAEKEAAKREKVARAEAEKEAAKKEKIAKAEAEKAAAEKEKMARAEAEKAAAEKEKMARAEAEKEAAKKEKIAKAEAEKAAAEKEKMARAEAEKEAAKKEKMARAESVATPAATPKKEQPKVSKAEAAPPSEKAARGPDSYHKGAEKSTSTKVAEKKSEPLSYEEELKRTEPATNKTFSEPTPLPKTEASENAERRTPNVEHPITESSQPSTLDLQPSAEETPPVLHEPATEQTPEVAKNKPETTNPQSEQSRDSSSAPAPKETPADISVNSLAGPPSSLRTIPESSSSEKSQAEPESAPKSDGPLDEAEVVKMADTEARVQGAPLDNYDRPKVDHSQVKGKWTLFYAPKKGEAGADMPPFSVTIEDKSRKVDLRK